MSDNDYVFKIDSPWGNKGEKVPSAIFCGFTTGTGERYNKVYYHEWPDLFEKVKSDEEVVKEFIEISLAFEISPYVVSRLLGICPDLADRIRRGK